MHLRLLFLAGLVVTAGCAFAQRRGGPSGPVTTEIPVFKKILEAHRTLRLAGVRRVDMKVDGERRQYFERVLQDGPRTRIEFPTDSPYAGQIWVETPERRLQFLPGPNEIRETHGRSWDSAYRFLLDLGERGRKMFRMETADGGQIARIATKRIDIIRTQDGKFFQRLWVDEGRGMVLKRDIYDLKGERLGGYEFTRLKYGVPLPADAFEIKRPGAKIVTVETELKTLARELGVPAKRLPESASLKLLRVSKFKVDSVSVLRQFYAGSAGRFSLYITKGDVKPEWTRGLSSERFKVYEWRSGGFAYVLIGDAEVATLRRMAASLGD